MRVTEIRAEHLAQIAELERECFSEPWSEKSLELLLDGTSIGVVATDAEGRVAAYGGMTCVLDEGQITNIATFTRCRRQGLGRAVVLALLERAAERGIASVFLEVRESNVGARALYEGCGFEVIGRRPKFYKKPVEDAILMERKI